MEAVAQQIAERVRDAPMVRIVTHIDTDGITGGAIASEALDRAGIAHEVAFVKKLDFKPSAIAFDAQFDR